MKGSKATAFALAVLLVAAEANSVKFKSAPLKLEQAFDNEKSSTKWELDQATNEYVSEEIIIPTTTPSQEITGELSATSPKWNSGITATVNEYVDKTVNMLLPLFREHGLDPMVLPDIVEGFEVPVLLVTLSAWLKLTKGSMTGLLNVNRFEDQKVNYFAKNLRVRVHLEFRDLEFNYNYLVQVMNIGPTGRIVASLNHFRVITDVLIDFNNDEVHLQEFKIDTVGRLRVRLRGNILVDWLLNPLVGVFTMLFNGVIMLTVEHTIRSVAQSVVTGINGAIREVVNQIEAINTF